MKEGYRNITDKLPAKVEKLYDAVIHLMEEGKNLSSLTVAEITEKAGIGKGTAYEYFRSKEEMIARAILYGILRSFEEIEHRIGRLSSFESKYVEVLNWLEEIFQEKIFPRPVNVAKAIYTSITGISPLMAEEVCYRAGIDGGIPTDGLEDVERVHLAHTFLRMVQQPHVSQ